MAYIICALIGLFITQIWFWIWIVCKYNHLKKRVWRIEEVLWPFGHRPASVITEIDSNIHSKIDHLTEDIYKMIAEHWQRFNALECYLDVYFVEPGKSDPRYEKNTSAKMTKKSK